MTGWTWVCAGTRPIRGMTAGLRHALHTAAPVQGHLGVDLGHGRAIGRGKLWLDAGLHLRGQTPLRFEAEVSTLARNGVLGITHVGNRFACHTPLRPALGYCLGRPMLLAEGEVTPCGRLQGLQPSPWSEV